MKYLISLSFALCAFVGAIQSQNSEEISLDNPAYVEWVSEHGFKIITEFKDGATLEASEVLDSEGNALPADVSAETFDITQYDFETIIAPLRNVVIKISDDKAIFIHSKRRQEILFKRYLLNQASKK